MTGAFKIAPAETSLSKFEMRTEIWESLWNFIGNLL